MQIFQCGWIYVITGPMFSGKTEEFNRTLRRFGFANINFLAFKPAKDTRSGDDMICTHNDGDEGIKGILVKDVAAIERYLAEKASPDVKVIGIDEGQFFNVRALTALARRLAAEDKKVVITALDRLWNGEFFDGVPELLAEADIVKKEHAICAGCGGLAAHSYRLTSSTNDVEVGGREKYEPLCRGCFIKKTQA